MKFRCPSLLRSLYWNIESKRLVIEPWEALPKALDQNLRIAIVGNAGYLLDCDVGERIDDFDLVIRMNNFRLSGYERHIGSRNDVVITNFSRYSIDFSNPGLRNCRMLVSSRPMNFLRHRKLGIEDRLGEHVTAGMKALRARHVFVPDLHYFTELTARLERYPTTGLMALHLVVDILSSHCRELFLTGFSFFDGRTHYFSDQTVNAGQLHNVDAERNEFAKIIDQNRNWISIDPIMQAHLYQRDNEQNFPPALADTRRIA